MKAKIVVGDAWDIPAYQTPGAAGMDLHANNDSPIMLKPLERKLIPTGLKIAVPEGLEASIRPRSGLVLTHGVTVLNSPGTVDSDYTGYWGIILFNASDKNFFVNKGDRIAQVVFSRYERIEWEEVQELLETERGEGGYGSTGKK